MKNSSDHWHGIVYKLQSCPLKVAYPHPLTGVFVSLVRITCLLKVLDLSCPELVPPWEQSIIILL